MPSLASLQHKGGTGVHALDVVDWQGESLSFGSRYTEALQSSMDGVFKWEAAIPA